MSHSARKVWIASSSRSQKRRAEDDTRHSEKAKRRRTETQSNSAPTPIAFKALENICKNEVPENAILELASKAERFDALLSLDEIRPDLLKLIIRSFGLLCSSNNLVSANKEKILRSSNAKKFISGLVLSRFINAMPYSSDSSVDSVIHDLAVVFKAMIQKCQRGGEAIVHELPIPQLRASFASLKEKKLIKNVNELEKKLLEVDELKEEMILQSQNALESQAEPPQNFQELSIIPDAADLLLSKPFLRKNITDGKYNDLEHYLDVQFRLLREDFVIPLRQGVRHLKKESNTPKTNSAKRPKVQALKGVSLYHKVTILGPVYSKNGMFYRIKFDQSHSSVKKVKWERSNRLKFGSLVCLSPDDFNSLVFATVENRDSNGLSVGELEVKFVNLTTEQVYHFVRRNEKFVMIESPAYFESYRHVLEALKTIQAEELPFQRYIVECCQEVSPPQYLLQTLDEKREEGEIVFDFSAIIAERKPATLPDDLHPLDPFQVKLPKNYKTVVQQTTTVHSEEAIAKENGTQWQDNQPAGAILSEDVAMDSEIPPEGINWPDRESLGFNESQMRAFKLALTKEFAVIQGPPGTGKTYVGLKIAQALLGNKSLWNNSEKKSPLLMVSYTNHALDQFLEGLLPLIPSEAIVRVGGRSKSGKLERCTLKARKVNSPAWIKTQVRSATRRDVLSQKLSLQHSSLVLRASRSSVMSLHVLRECGCIREEHFNQFEDSADEGLIDDQLLRWLDINRSQRNREEEDLLMHVAASGYKYSDEDRFDRDADTIHEIAVLSITEADNPGYVRRNLLNINHAMSEREEHRVGHVADLEIRERWRLYLLWRQRLEKHHHNNLDNSQTEFDEAVSRNKELDTLQECAILEKARVIGMTTTCAAKYRRVLQRICPKIILVEEAAEVLEAHVITSLTKGCQHLILIGDHQQLRPTPAVYDLARNYKLDVSLFERMVNIGIHRERLSVQHRMRPEIAALMKHIYKDLENHRSVEQYDDIKGMKKNLFFVNHDRLEDHNDELLHSHSNEHEATFLVALCRYLLQQGYNSKQVTLLTTYSGQLFLIRDCLKGQKDEELNHVRLSTVDNFQGEESDIILLSLVRSNTEENAGFIKDVNRACVALSRAKKGFYCIGNFDLLSRHCEIWKKIVIELKATGGIGGALPLVCQIHNEEATAERAEDFNKKGPDGGCSRTCGIRLKCGHSCKQFCHPRDKKHKEYVCREPCARFVRGCTQHLCPNRCNEICIWPCKEEVEKPLPVCGHIVKMECGRTDLESVPCEERCSKILKCGHNCQSYCKKPCTTECQVLVKKNDWSCGHEVTIACCATPDQCTVPCRANLECGHECPGTCGECRMGRIHKRCRLKCGRVLVCSHACKAACAEPCPPCARPCENRCTHSKCDKKCGELCISCNERCSWICQHYDCRNLCHEICARPRCNEPCQKILECRHICRGLMCEEYHKCICVVCTLNDGMYPITDLFLGGEDDEGALFIRLPDCGHIFAVSDLDRYMDMQNDKAESHEIQMKRCPRCSTTIRLSLRYGNIIKQQLRDIEKVKKAMHQKTRCEPSKKWQLLGRLGKVLSKFGVENYSNTVWQRLWNKIVNDSMAALFENRVMLMERRYLLNEKMKANLDLSVDICQENKFDWHLLDRDISYLSKRFMSEQVSQRELQDINTEFSRINLQFELCLLSRDVKGLDLAKNDNQMMSAVREKLSSGERIKDEILEELLKSLATIRKSYPSLNPLTPEEKKQIVSAMGLKKGHWFKCPKDHVYCITECGGAMERSTCPECKAVIGGQNHKLEEGNTLAPEMDEAQYPAWSEQANMQNYDLR